MKFFLVLIATCCLGVSWVSGEGEVPECPGLTQEQRAQLKALTVKEEIHDQLVGNLTEVWGVKHLKDNDGDVCYNLTSFKIDDTHLFQIWHKGNDWNTTMEKVENGVYILKRTDGTLQSKLYFLHMNGTVLTHFGCPLQASDAAATTHTHSNVHINVRVPELGVYVWNLKLPFDPEVKGLIDEAVAITKEHRDLLGNFEQYNTHDCID